MKKIFLILILFFLTIKVNASLLTEDASYSKYSFNFSFEKIDFDDIYNGNRIGLKDASFGISSINNNYIFNVNYTFDEQYNVYMFDEEKIVSVNDLYKVLPQSVKDLFDSINTYDDYQDIINEGRYKDAQNYYYWYDSENNIYNSNTFALFVQIPLKIIEKKTPIGYQKNEVIILADAYLIYNFKPENNNVDNKQIFINYKYKYLFYKYDQNTNFDSIITSSYSMRDYFLNCDSYSSFIPDKKGNVDLKIDNTINGKYYIDTNNNQKLSFKINIKNDGNASSGNNNVRIIIPKVLNVEENSISDNGNYNKDENEIVWNIDYLGPNEIKDLTFDINVPSDVKGEYKLNSIISNDSSNVVARKATLNVNEEIENPNTGYNNYIIVTFFILFIDILFYLIINRRKSYSL